MSDATSHRAAKDIIAKRVACDIAGWHDDPLCNDPECWVCDEGRRVADWIMRDLEAAGFTFRHRRVGPDEFREALRRSADGAADE